jgi:hypothetical protein
MNPCGGDDGAVGGVSKDSAQRSELGRYFKAISMASSELVPPLRPAGPAW